MLGFAFGALTRCEVSIAAMNATVSVEALPDLLRPGLYLVVCGTAAGKRSAAQGAYYKDSRNKFWSILAATRLSPCRLAPHEYERLLEFDIGLTDLAKHVSGGDDSLRATHYDVDRFRDKIRNACPRVLAFNGKTAASIHFQVQTKNIDYGHQPNGIQGTVVFVLPSTSGRARAYWKPYYWHACASYIQSIRSELG